MHDTRLGGPPLGPAYQEFLSLDLSMMYSLLSCDRGRFLWHYKYRTAFQCFRGTAVLVLRSYVAIRESAITLICYSIILS